MFGDVVGVHERLKARSRRATWWGSQPRLANAAVDESSRILVKYAKNEHVIVHGEALPALADHVQDQSVDLVFADPPYPGRRNAKSAPKQILELEVGIPHGVALRWDQAHGHGGDLLGLLSGGEDRLHGLRFCL